MALPLHRSVHRRSRTVVLALTLAVLGAATAPATAQVALSEASIEDIGRAFDAGTLTAERLVEMYLARIAAYEATGPALNAVLHVNPNALETARALDRERRERGPRSPLHGIPVVLKDNVDTGDMPTTAGSLLLAGSVPPDDAFIVRRVREAGAIILAKANMSEFASGPTMSSVAGPMRNPHDLARSPSGSSGGTGVAIAASYAQLGIGTDTGGSVRGPTASNGIAGLKPTQGLVSRDGIVPLSLTFDVAGPMARHVYDVAAMLDVLAGTDPADPATAAADQRRAPGYVDALDAGALDGARIGIARDFMGQDAEVDWVLEAALHTMREAGATVVDVRYPTWLLEAKGDWYTTIRWPDFRAAIPDYLATLGPTYPKTLAEMVERTKEIVSLPPGGGAPNPTRWSLFEDEERSGSTDAAAYVTMRDHGLPLVRGVVEGLLAEHELDAIVYPTSPTRPGLIAGGGGGGGPSATNIANLTGFPDLIVPAGFTNDRLPVALSFFGPAFSEARLLGLGYAFDQLTRARRDPAHAPALPGERVGG